MDGHLGYLATVAVPRTLPAGAYRLTVIATSAHGSGAAKAIPLGLLAPPAG